MKTKAEARRLEKELIIEVNDFINRKVTRTWQNVMEDCFVTMRNDGITEKTILNYSLCLNAHTLPLWENRLIDSITTAEIRELVKVRLEKKSANHQKNVLKFIRKVFNHAVETGEINRDPTPKLKFRVGDKIKKVLTAPQAELLLNTAKEMDVEWYPHWVGAIYSGMRSGELYALTWDKVDLDQRTILVDCSWNKTDGFKDTKSGDDRIVEIAPNLLTILKELKVSQYDSAFVYPRLEKWDRGEAARELKLFLAGLGLPQVRFHDLRATWATIMLSQGIPPIKVMKMGGWKTMDSMMIYARKAGVDIRGVTDQLDLHNPSKGPASVVSIQGYENPRSEH